LITGVFGFVLVHRKELDLNLPESLCFEEIWDFITTEKGALFEGEFDRISDNSANMKLNYLVKSNKA